MPVYYVRPDGNDSNTGLGPSVDLAKKTVNAAVSIAVAGDTIWLAPGAYAGPTLLPKGGASWDGSKVSIIGEPTGSVFGVSPDTVRMAGAGKSGTSSSWAYYLFKNIVFTGWIDMGDYNSFPKDYRLYNCCAVNQYFIVGSYYKATRLYFYNCSLYGQYIKTANSSPVYIYNTAFKSTAMRCNVDGWGGATLRMYYCIGDGTLTGVTENQNFIAADPLFVDLSYNDFRLLPESLAINSGFDYLGTFADPDVYGSERLIGTIDRGASEAYLFNFEFTYPAVDGDNYYYSSGPKVRLRCPSPPEGVLLNIHFKVMSYQDEQRATLIQSWDSAVNPERFEYWNGTLWLPFPSSGLGSSYYGNEVRCNLTLPPRLDYFFTAVAYAAE